MKTHRNVIDINDRHTKLKSALLDKYEDESAKLPKPTGWRLLVLPFKGKKKLKEESIIPTNKSKDNNLLQYVEMY